MLEQCSSSDIINTTNFRVVLKENGEILSSDDGNICLQSLKDGDLCFIKPTLEICNALNIFAETKEYENLEPTAGATQYKNRVKWSKEAITLLINLRIDLEAQFRSTTMKTEVAWKLVAEKLQKNGFRFTSTQCNDKWRYLKAKYTAAKDNRSDKGTGEEPVDFPYYDLMDTFLGKKHNVLPVAIASSIRGDTMPSEENVSVETTAEDIETNDDGNSKANFPKKLKTCSTKCKANCKKFNPSKTGLCAVWGEMKENTKERESNRERRHQETLVVRNRAIDVFSEKMDLLLDKIKK